MQNIILDYDADKNRWVTNVVDKSSAEGIYLTAKGFRKGNSPCFHTTKVLCVLEILKSANLTEQAKNKLTEVQKELKDGASGILNSIRKFEEAANFKFYPFQIEDAIMASQLDAVLNTNEPGAGKTLWSLALIPEKGTALVIGPKISRNVWKREVERFRPDLKPVILEKFRMPNEGEVAIINYDRLLPTKRENKKGDWIENHLKKIPSNGVIIIDEIHTLTNVQLQKTKRVRKLVGILKKKNWKRIGLSGTPIEKEYKDLWSILQTLDAAKEVFGSWERYFHLMGGEGDFWSGITWKKEKQDPSAPELLSRVTIRRKLADIHDQMPDKVRKYILVDLEDSILKNSLNNVLSEITKLSKEESLRYLGKNSQSLQELRVKLAKLKVNEAREFINLRNSEEPLVVMSYFKEPLKVLCEERNWPMITGDTPEKDRVLYMQQFQEGRIPGIGLTIGAASLAITLTRSNEILFLDRDWNASTNWQAENRIYRLGQTKPCVYNYLIFDHPLEDRLSEIIAYKEHLHNSMIEKIESQNLVHEKISELL